MTECFCGIELEAGLCPNGHDPVRPAEYTVPAKPAQPQSSDELIRLRQAIGWICDAADAAYIEDANNERIHEIFNIAAQAAGLTRRLPDEHGRFDETSIS